MYIYILTWITNPNILILIPPSEVQETKSLKSTLSQPAHPITCIYMNLRLQLNSWPL
jgi:hypothetical protein